MTIFTVAEARSAVADAEAEVEAARKRLTAANTEVFSQFLVAREWLRLNQPYWSTVDRQLAAQCAALAAPIPVEIYGGFDDPRWETWSPSEQPQAVFMRDEDNGAYSTVLRVGSLDDNGVPSPALVRLVGQDRSFIIRSDAATEKTAHRLLQALVLRIAAQLPRQVRFTLLDPVGYGRTFPMAKSLPAVRETGDDIGGDVRAVLQDVRRLMKDVIGFHERFDKLPAETQAGERYEIIVAADFPKARAYDRRCIEALAELARVGPQAGRFLFLHWPKDAPLPREAQDVAFDGCVELDLTVAGLTWDGPPEPSLTQKILTAIRDTKSTAPAPGVERLVPPDESWWKESSAEALVAPVGAQADLTLRFDGSLKSHALVSAAAGGGKSNLLHALILGLASRYGPEELELYLVDLKEGVEFNAYRRLPHAAVVSLNTEPALARAVVGDLCAELQRRLELFNNARVQNLTTYRKAGSPGGRLPRILLIVDEYQELFRDAPDDRVSDDLRLLATQGRAPGVHMVLASQTAGAPAGMLHARQIMDNVLTRVVLRLRPDAIAGLTDFGPAGREMIRSCDQPGKVVINDQGGQDGGNRLGQVAFVEPETRDRAVVQMERMARDAAFARVPQVFDGKESPLVGENPVIRSALDAPRAPDAATLGTLARRRWGDGGFDRPDWRPADRPLPLWIGRQRHIHGHATVLLGRRDGAHLLIVGGAAEGARGILAGTLASLAAVADPAGFAVELFAPGEQDPLLDRFAAVAAARGLEVAQHRTPAAVTERVIALAATLDTPPNGVERSRVLVLLDPDDDPDLRRPSDPMSRDRSPALAALRRILSDGPRSGLHAVLAMRSPRAVAAILDDRRGDLRLIRWRAAVKMSEDDSRRIFDQAGAAARLDGRAAVLQDLENASVEAFMPYRPELPSPSDG